MRFQTLWLSIYHYCLAHWQEMAFLEQYESIPMTKQQEVQQSGDAQTLGSLLEGLKEPQMIENLSSEAKILYSLIADLHAQNLLKDLPLAVIGEFTFGMALRMARQAFAGMVRFDEVTLSAIAWACWNAIAR